MATATECVNAWNAALARGDRETMNGLLHSDYKLIEPMGTPYPGIFRGAAGWWSFWEQFCQTWSEIEVTNAKIFLSDSPGECTIMMDLKGRAIATGKPFSTSLIEYWRFADGKILEMRPHYCDTHYLRVLAGG